MTTPTVHSSPVSGLLRLAVYLVWTVIGLPLQLLALLFRLPLARRLPRFYHRMCCRIFGIKLEVFGRRSRARPTLFVGNHSSYLDISIYGALIDGSFVAKTEVGEWPFFGILAKAQRSVFVDRRISSSREQASALRQRLEARDNLILFPEGTSNDGTSVLPFKSALFAVAEIEVRGKPIAVQPVSISYTRLDGVPIGRHLRPFFAWYGDMELVPHIRQLVGLGRPTVTVTFHDPVTIAAFGSRKALAEHCHAVVARSHADALAGRLQPPAGAAGRWRWIRWRRRPLARDRRARKRGRRGRRGAAARPA